MLALFARKVLATPTCTSPPSDSRSLHLHSLEQYTWAQHYVQCHQDPGHPRGGVVSGSQVRITLPSEIILGGKVRRNLRGLGVTDLDLFASDSIPP